MLAFLHFHNERNITWYLHQSFLKVDSPHTDGSLAFSLCKVVPSRVWQAYYVSLLIEALSL